MFYCYSVLRILSGVNSANALPVSPHGIVLRHVSLRIGKSEATRDIVKSSSQIEAVRPSPLYISS